MQLQNYFAQDKSGNALPGATVYVLLAGTATMATGLQDKTGAPKENPFLSDSQGLIQFAAANGDYDIRVVKGPHDYKLTSVRFEDSKQFRLDVADATDPAKGAGMVGYSNRNLNVRLDERPHLSDFYQVADGSDWYPATQRAIAAGKVHLFVPAGSYGFSQTVFWPVGTDLLCETRKVTFFPLPAATLTDGFLMMWNTADGSTWATQFPNMRSGSITGAQFTNPNTLNPCRGIKAFCPLRTKELRFSDYTQSIQRPASLYIDSSSAEDIIIENPLGSTEYQIEWLGFGDGLYAKDVHFVYNRNTSLVTKGFHIRSSRGCSLDSLIGGDHLLEQCRGVSIRGLHNEQGQINFSNSSGTVETFEVYPTDRPPFIVTNESISPNAETFTVTFKDGCQVFVERATNPVSALPIMQFDGQFANVANGCRVVIDNVCRSWQVDGDLSRNQLHGITLANLAGAAITSWNDYSYINSRRSELNTGSAGKVSMDGMIYASDNTFTGISPASLSGFVDITGTADQWDEATGTYYYKAILFYDTGRLIGRQQTSAEWSVVVPSASGMVRFFNGLSAIPRTCILRVFRGTASNSYDKFVDIHIMGGDYLYDTGLKVCGKTWQSRSAGPVDSINAIDARQITFKGINVNILAGSQPSTGAWVRGDYIDRINTTISAGTLLTGHKRLTTNSSHTPGTDWAALTPAAS